MTWFHWIYWLTGSTIGLFLVLLARSALQERRSRALVVCVLALVFFGPAWYGWYATLSASEATLLIPVAVFVLFLIVFFGPIGDGRLLSVGAISERVDERDVMFAREEYKPGSDKYEQYYRWRPENKEIDDRLRDLPELLAPGGRYYDEKRSGRIRDLFMQVAALTTQVDGPVADYVQPILADQITRDIKQRVLNAGADEVGVAVLNPMFVYSHVGRGPEPWGEPINNQHRLAIAFTVEMDYFCVEAAPDLRITEEAACRYLQAARISIDLARYIRSIGYPARAHISDSNYQIMLPPVAHDAGLGEIGRIGFLVSPRFGARIRLGAATTDLPLAPDHPRSFGLQDFCDKCLKCAANCPSSAITKYGPVDVRGVKKWPLRAEQCLRYWRLIGTDCGLCMRVCPFSHPPTLVHNIIRAGIRRSSFARTLSVWGDDLLYGRKVHYPIF
jgi:reductive dehalogenase